MAPELDPEAVVGCLLGQAVGDMMGLPAENLSPRRVKRLFPNLDRPRFFLGYGMGSDDTEHACLTASAIPLMAGYGIPYDPAGELGRRLAWRLRWWFLAGPPGIGRATFRACVKLWLGFPWTMSGVFSAGNGPAMRTAVLGVCSAPHNRSLLKVWVSQATRVTHTDPKAECGAFAVAALARLAVLTRGAAPPTPTDLSAELEDLLPAGKPADGFRDLLSRVANSMAAGLTVTQFAESLGLQRGVTGYIYHTVPVALFAFFRHPDDYRTAVEAVIRCGGDTDTVAAITGALIGARVGKVGIPVEWLSRYRDWPWSASAIERLGRTVAQEADGHSVRRWDLFPQVIRTPLVFVRNLLFFVIVLGHIARRLLPPY